MFYMAFKTGFLYTTGAYKEIMSGGKMGNLYEHNCKIILRNSKLCTNLY